MADYTGQPEILGGRVKTLHPRIHAGILARRNVPEDLQVLAGQAIDTIDLVVVNLYPFEATVANPAATFEDAVENIDIGGPSLIRAAAKNHEHVAVLTDPDQYAAFLDEVQAPGRHDAPDPPPAGPGRFRPDGHLRPGDHRLLRQGRERRREPGGEVPAVARTSPFRFGRRSDTERTRTRQAAFYVDPHARGPNLATAEVLHGKELSYNNLLDLDSALRLIRMFAEPAACILKHNNPCGAAIAGDLATAFDRAYEGDPVSAFGGIVGLNRPVDLATAERMGKPGRFLEAIVAPGFQPDALRFLTTKPSWKNSVRLIDLEGSDRPGRPGSLGPGPEADRGRAARPGLGPGRDRPGCMAGGHPARAHRERARRPGVCLAGVRRGQVQRHRCRPRRPAPGGREPVR